LRVNPSNTVSVAAVMGIFGQCAWDVMKDGEKAFCTTAPRT